MTPAGALVLTDDASPTPPGEVRTVDDNANDSNDESAEDIYDLRPDPELTAMAPRNTTSLQEQPASSLLFVPAATTALTPTAGDGEYFHFPSLDSHDDDENDNENDTTAVAGVVASANPEVAVRNDDAEETRAEEVTSTAAE